MVLNLSLKRDVNGYANLDHEVLMKGFILLSFLFLNILNAQAQFKISGKVTNTKNDDLPFVIVKIFNGDKQISYSQTDSLGVYNLNNLKEGAYSVLYSGLFITEKKRIINLKSDTIINVTVDEISNNLKDVNISFRKNIIERKIDRTVFNAENSIAAIGTDALELLAKIPGVRVLNDKVSLVGKGTVNVMINDRLIQLTADDLSDYLKSISSDNISKIEIITNPPAKYDAQGNSGLINIVLKKVSTELFSGSVNAGFNQAAHPTFSSGGNLNFRKNKITIFSNLNFRKGSLVPFEQSNVFYPNQTWNIVNKDRNFRTVPSGQIGIDYQLSKKAILGLSYNGGFTNFHSEEKIVTSIFNNASSLDSLLNSDANAKIRSHYNAVNIYFKQALDSAGKQITINGDWFKYKDDKSRHFDNTSYTGNGLVIPGSFAEYLSTSKQNIDLFTLKIDVDLPYKPFTLSFGSKLSFIKNESDVAFYQSVNDIYKLNPEQSNLFDYQENTQALYFNLNKSVKKWSFQLGLRGEHTQIKGVSLDNSNSNNYFKLFPTAFLSYKLNDKSTFSVNYGRRINRPAYKKLNPFRWYSNQYAYAEGNPQLQPSYNNNIEIAHNYASVFSTTFTYSHTSNGYNDVNFINANSNIQVLKPVNFITGYNYQISNAVTFSEIKWFDSTNQLDVFYSVFKSNIPQTLNRVEGYGAYVSTINQFRFNQSKTFLGDVSFWYQFPTIDGLNKNKSQYNLDLGLKTILMNKTLQIALNATDVLKTNKYRFSSLINNLKQEYNNYYDSRQLRLTIRYNFGSDKLKQRTAKAGNEEERRRSQ